MLTDAKCHADFGALLTPILNASRLPRTLVVDGRAQHKSNGVGNLFGDYLGWFLVAALSQRRLIIDWRRDNERPRFSLSDYFTYEDGTSWGGAAVRGSLDGPATAIVIDMSAATLADMPACALLYSTVMSSAPTVTMRLGPWSAAMLPTCQDTAKKIHFGWPYDAASVSGLVARANVLDAHRHKPRFRVPSGFLWRQPLGHDPRPAGRLWGSLLSCLLRAMLHPSKRLLPLTKAARHEDAAVIAHIRTGWSDDGPRPLRPAEVNQSRALAADGVNGSAWWSLLGCGARKTLRQMVAILGGKKQLLLLSDSPHLCERLHRSSPIGSSVQCPAVLKGSSGRHSNYLSTRQDGLRLALDMWRLGEASHVVGIGKSTFTSWRVRGSASFLGLGQFEKILPVCPACADSLVNYNRNENPECETRRRLVFGPWANEGARRRRGGRTSFAVET